MRIEKWICVVRVAVYKGGNCPDHYAVHCPPRQELIIVNDSDRMAISLNKIEHCLMIWHVYLCHTYLIAPGTFHQFWSRTADVSLASCSNVQLIVPFFEESVFYLRFQVSSMAGALLVSAASRVQSMEFLSHKDENPWLNTTDNHCSYGPRNASGSPLLGQTIVHS